MNTRLLKVGFLFALVLVIGPIAQAHHSFCVEYDSKKPFSFSGKITKIVWANPHTNLYVDVSKDKNAAEQWILQASAPVAFLAQGGWKADTLKAGDEISGRVAPARDGQKRGGFMELVFKGSKLFHTDKPFC